MIKPTEKERRMIRDWFLAGDGCWVDIWHEAHCWAAEIDNTGIVFEGHNAPALLREIADILEEC